jgi:drug/metabolite transporter (DMT)-like permease
MNWSSRDPGLFPYLLLGFAGSMWGITFSLAKIATQAGAHPVGLTFWQAVVCLAVLGIFCLWRKSWPSINSVTLPRSTVIALVGTVLPSTFYFYAAMHLPVGILSITIAIVPIMTYGVCLAIGTDSYQLRRLFGLVLGFAGMVLLAHPEALPDRSLLPWLGVAAFCSLCYVAENIYVDKNIPANVDMAELLTLSMMIAVVILLPVMLPMKAFVALKIPFTAVEYSVIGMGLITSFSYLIFLYLIQTCGAVFASTMAYVVMVSGVVWGMLLFNEQHSLVVWLVLLIMVSGMLLVKPINKPLLDQAEH